VVKWELRFKKTAEKDSLKLKSAGLKHKADQILSSIELDPFYIPPPFEKLMADLKGYYSRRINKQHRIVYEINRGKKEIVIISMFLHYGE
jgi:Txe/YoeB family toxin of toxin-antitoxin system